MADARKQYQYDSDTYNGKRQAVLNQKNARENQINATCDDAIKKAKQVASSAKADISNPLKAIYMVPGMGLAALIGCWPLGLFVLVIVIGVIDEWGAGIIWFVIAALISLGMVWIFVSNLQKKKTISAENEKMDQIRAKQRKDLQDSENQYQKALAQINQEQRNHEIQIEQMAKQQYTGKGVPAVSMRLAKAANTAFKAEDNRSHIKIVSTKLTFQVNRQGVFYQYKKGKRQNMNGVWVDEIARECFDWVVENFNPLTDDNKCEATALATANYLADMYLKKFSNAKIEIFRNDSSVEMRLHQVNMNYVRPVDV